MAHRSARTDTRLIALLLGLMLAIGGLLVPGEAHASGNKTFTASLTTTDHALTVAAKQSNDFKGTGNDFTLVGNDELVVTLDCEDVDTGTTELPSDDRPRTQRPATEVMGEISQQIERDGQIVTATGPAGGEILLAFRDDRDGSTAGIVNDACQTLIEDSPDQPARLAANVFEVLPSGFADGDEITVTSTIPGDYVTAPTDYSTVPTGEFQVGEAPDDVNYTTAEDIRARLAAIRDNRGLGPDPASDEIWVQRILGLTSTIGDARTAISAKAAYESAEAFQLCFTGEKQDHGSLTGLSELDGTDLFGPVLLTACSDDVSAPCINERTKNGNEITIVVTIPAKDPWMR